MMTTTTAVPPKFAQNGDEKGKVFIGGLSWETTTASMLKYFSRYGEVIDCVVMKNQQTGKSRGFGFVKFREMTCVEAVLASGPHILDGRQIDPKACNPRALNKVGCDGAPKNTDAKNKNKIFLGGLPSNCTESQIKEVFSTFGKVNDVTIMWDQEKQKPRGFGFLSYEDDESVERVCLQHYITVAGKKVECKRAEPRELKELHALQFGGGMFTNGLAMQGMQGMQGMALGPGLMSSPYQALAAQQHQLAAAQGLALLPAGPHLIPLTMPGGGMSMMTAASMGEQEPGGWPPQMAAVSGHSPYMSAAHPSSQLGASQAALEQFSQQQDGQQVTGYISASPVPGSTTPEPPVEQSMGQKSPYILYGNPNSQLGILGNYHQEASSYGPARGFGQEGPMTSAIQTPYTASVTYAAGPGLTLQQASPYMQAMGNGYPGGVPLLAYGGQGDATSAAAYSAAFQAAAARSSSMAQGFHPYRR